MIVSYTLGAELISTATGIHYARPTRWIGAGTISLERRRSECLFCYNSLNNHDKLHPSTLCRPIEEVSKIVYTGNYVSSFGNLPALQVPAGLADDILKTHQYPRPISQKIIIATPEVATEVPDKLSGRAAIYWVTHIDSMATIFVRQAKLDESTPLRYKADLGGGVIGREMMIKLRYKLFHAI